MTDIYVANLEDPDTCSMNQQVFLISLHAFNFL